MIDMHCHIDLYSQPTAVAQAVEKAGVSTVVVTNLPSAYKKAEPHVRQFKKLRLALGLHPLLANQHEQERAEFARLSEEVFYIGEIGLDFSREGYSTKDIQIESFQFVLQALNGKAKFLIIHSRRAEAQVLEMLNAAKRSPSVFHWYSGSLKTLRDIIHAGHYFSINPAMVNSPNGQKIISALPKERVLTETDGPFVKVGSRIVTPLDIELVEKFLADEWQIDRVTVSSYIKNNFSRLLNETRKNSDKHEEKLTIF